MLFFSLTQRDSTNLACKLIVEDLFSDKIKKKLALALFSVRSYGNFSSTS